MGSGYITKKKTLCVPPTGQLLPLPTAVTFTLLNRAAAMSLSLALGSSTSSSAVDGRGGGVAALTGISLSGSSPPLLRPPLQRGLPRLGSHRLRRDARCSLSNSGRASSSEGEGEKTSFCWASGPVTAAAFTSLRPRWCSYPGIIHKNEKARGDRVVCSASPLDFETLQWISSIACLVLMLSRGTAIQKSFLAPLFALQAPTSVISWIQGEYGIWTAFLALLVRLFYFIPGELDLPFLTMLLVIVSPRQTMNLRETKTGAIMSLVIAGYLLFQHFSTAGSLQKAFDQGAVVATLAIICIIVVPCVLLF